MHGREQCHALVLSSLRAAESENRGAVLLIEAEPGMGRTTLLTKAAETAAERGFTVAAGKAEEHGGRTPLASLLLALGRLPGARLDHPPRPHSGRAPSVRAEHPRGPRFDRAPGFRSNDTNENRSERLPDVRSGGTTGHLSGRLPGARFHGRSAAQWLRYELERRTTAGPVLVTLDDLHWADPGTLLLLRTLPGQLGSCPLVWILTRAGTDGTGRRDDAGGLFAALESEGAARIELEPLDAEAVAALTARLLGAEPGDELLMFTAGAGGNPLLLTELLTGLRDEGLLVPATPGTPALSAPPTAAPPVALPRLASPISVVSASATPASNPPISVAPLAVPLPYRFRVAVRHRLAGLAEKTLRFLEIAAILGRSFDPGDAAEMLETTPALVWPQLREALAAGLLDSVGEEIAFRHELVWCSLLQEMPEPMARALHRQAGEMLLNRGRAVAAATHLMAGAPAGDPSALAGLDQAAAQVLLSSPETAADLAVRALELTPEPDPRRQVRTVAAVEACTAAGRLGTATSLVRSALDQRSPEPDSGRLHTALSTLLHLSGHPAEARDEAATALRESPQPGDPREDAELAMLQALATLREDRAAAELAATIVERPDHHGDALVVGAMIVLAVTGWHQARITEALTHCREAVRRASTGSPAARRLHPGLILAGMLTDLRQIPEARAVLRAAAEEVETLGHVLWAGVPHILGSRLELATGHLADAVTAAEGGLALTRGLGADLFTPIAKAVLATVALRRGDLAAAATLAGQGRLASAHHGAIHAQRRCALVEAQVAEARSDTATAVDWALDLLSDPEHPGLLASDPTLAPWLVRVCRRQASRGSPGEVRVTPEGLRHSSACSTSACSRVVEVVEAIALGNPGFAALEAAAAHARGVRDGDRCALERAMKEHVDPWARASAAEDLGSALAAEGDHQQAIVTLERAIADYQETEARRDAARVRRRLRRLGVRHRHWTSAQRPVSGWASLTETERLVSELVAQGLTNQQTADQMFLSVHTVAFHLRQVFRKLEITSRVDLTRIALQQKS